MYDFFYYKNRATSFHYTHAKVILQTQLTATTLDDTQES